jgi:AmiR/NasT family two-component response regulator
MAQAYFRLRRLSRQRRVPMREIASEIIAGAVQPGGA